MAQLPFIILVCLLRITLYPKRNIMHKILYRPSAINDEVGDLWQDGVDLGFARVAIVLLLLIRCDTASTETHSTDHLRHVDKDQQN